nr:MAG TPA: hypothetical protein [Caudoviricetes sp.]DAT64797.1 MAG TPA: hypothetical protein [Caudoviricetes sp.]
MGHYLSKSKSINLLYHGYDQSLYFLYRSTNPYS